MSKSSPKTQVVYAVLEERGTGAIGRSFEQRLVIPTNCSVWDACYEQIGERASIIGVLDQRKRTWID